MAEYHVPKMENPDWDAVSSVSLSHTGWLSPAPVSAKAWLCHSQTALFVRMEAVEPKIRATLTGRLDQVCNDSCLEFFFAPMAEDCRYFNFEVNPLGTLNLGFGAERKTRVRQLVKKPEMFEIKPYSTPDGWGFTMTLPLDYIRLYFPDFSFHGAASCNFYKCGDETETPHYLAWNRPACDTPDFHRRKDFGRLVFQD